jgi:hypothetical protein
MRTARLIVLAALVVGCGGGPAATENLPGPFSGDSAAQTASFTLKGGDYVVDWTARNTFTSGAACFFNPTLKTNDGGYEEVASVDVDTTKQATANAHGVAAGTWYFDVNTHCAWTLRLRH